MMSKSFVLALFLVMAPCAAMAQAAGKVVDVAQPAEIVADGSARTIVRDSPVANGDTIRTGGSGQVQILFQDKTKIVVGPNSSLRIDEALFRRDGKARKFATSALGGTFRFISGNSPRRVYTLATPVATMGIRGTAFDYTVVPGESTDLLVFDGLVRFCAAGQRCVTVPGGCQAVTAGRDGGFTQPLSAAAKRDLLNRRFPLLARQPGFQPAFRVSTTGCDTIAPIDLSADRGGDRANRGGDNPADGPSDPGGGGGNPAE